MLSNVLLAPDELAYGVDAFYHPRNRSNVVISHAVNGNNEPFANQFTGDLQAVFLPSRFLSVALRITR